MFADCSSLTSVNLLSIDTKNVKYMFMMFCGCSLLEIFNIPGINNQFGSINEFGLQKYNNFSTENVENIGYILGWCTKIIYINISNWNLTNVKSISGMFSGCNELETIIFGNSNFEKIQAMDSLFSYYQSLKSVDLSIFKNASNIKTMSDMFLYYQNLKENYK